MLSRIRQLPEPLGRLAQRDDLRVGGRVLAQLALVVAGPDHLAGVRDDRADRDVVVLQGALRLAQGQAHEVLVRYGHGALSVADRTNLRVVRQLPCAEAVLGVPLAAP